MFRTPKPKVKKSGDMVVKKRDENEDIKEFFAD
jgi:hypothetical protein